MSAQSVHAFSEKVAVITDGAHPIGRAVALQLALQGSYVIVAISEANEHDASALDELKSLGTLASVVEADVSRPEGIATLIGAAGASFGRIDLLVNLFPESAASARLLIGAAHDLMASRPKPKIVNVAKYSKADVKLQTLMDEISSVTESLGEELPGNFRVNMVSAGEGFGRVDAGLDPELFPARKGIDADDAARVAVFLLSSESTGINGRNIIVGR